MLTPVYNAVHHVARYEADVARQARQPDQIVLYDDGSTDGTGDLLAEWAARDRRVRLIDGGTNRGRGAARQALLEAVETDYVAWLDVDDFWHPQKLHVQVEEFEALERGGASVLLSSPLCQVNSRSGGSSSIALSRTYGLDDYLRLARDRNQVVMLQSVFGTRDDFQRTGFDAELNWSEDFDFFIRFLGAGGRIVPQQNTTASAMYIHDIVGRDPRQIRRAHDYVYAKNRRLWTDEEDPEIEKALRRLGYVVYAFRMNGDAAGAEAAYLDAAEVLSARREYRGRLVLAARSVLKAHAGDVANYVRFAHDVGNAGRSLQCHHGADGYAARSLRTDRLRWKVTGGEGADIGEGGELADHVVREVYLEGARRVTLSERRANALRREFIVEAIPGGAIVLIPAEVRA